MNEKSSEPSQPTHPTMNDKSSEPSQPTPSDQPTVNDKSSEPSQPTHPTMNDKSSEPSQPTPFDQPTVNDKSSEHSQPTPFDQPTVNDKSSEHSQPTPTMNDKSSEPSQPTPSDQNQQDPEKWGTHIMGQPAAPSSHPNNQKAAAQWNGQDHHPYIQNSPVDKPNNNPIEPVIHVFNSWTTKAETLARNLWQNLRTGSSVSDAALGKLGLTAKAVTGGGFEPLYKQTFNTLPNEKLKKTFACYLSTSTGPVAGTLYLSNIHVAFCSDRPLCFTAPSGQGAWSYYKVMIPLVSIGAVTPVIMKESERYIQITTVDDHEFWFMGFVNYEKASHHLAESVAEHQTAALPIG